MSRYARPWTEWASTDAGSISSMASAAAILVEPAALDQGTGFGNAGVEFLGRELNSTIVTTYRFFVTPEVRERCPSVVDEVVVVGIVFQDLVEAFDRFFGAPELPQNHRAIMDGREVVWLNGKSPLIIGECIFQPVHQVVSDPAVVVCEIGSLVQSESAIDVAKSSLRVVLFDKLHAEVDVAFMECDSSHISRRLCQSDRQHSPAGQDFATDLRVKFSSCSAHSRSR